MDRFDTLRIRATRLSIEDLPDLVDLHLDAEVSRFLGGVRTPAATTAYVEAALRHWDDHGLGLWTLRSPKGVFLGRAGLRHVELGDDVELEIAYTLVRAAWGRGLATEVAQAMVGLWRDECSQKSLIGIVMKGNAPSERVLAKVGLSSEREVTFHGAPCNLFRKSR